MRPRVKISGQWSWKTLGWKNNEKFICISSPLTFSNYWNSNSSNAVIEFVFLKILQDWISVDWDFSVISKLSSFFSQKFVLGMFWNVGYQSVSKTLLRCSGCLQEIAKAPETVVILISNVHFWGGLICCHKTRRDQVGVSF